MTITLPDRPLPEGWQWVRLGEVCAINPKKPADMPHSSDMTVSFVPMASVRENAGGIAPIDRKLNEVVRGYTYFREGDVLFSKITPCMENGKHAIARNLTNGLGFGTTEFHVLRPGSSVIAEWVHYFLCQSHIIEEAVNNFTGTAGQRRVPKAFLQNLRIPLPPLAEQRRIVARLEERLAAAERARSAAEDILAAMAAMPKALLREILP